MGGWILTDFDILTSNEEITIELSVTLSCCKLTKKISCNGNLEFCMGIILFKKYNAGQTSFGSQSYIPELLYFIH